MHVGQCATSINATRYIYAYWDNTDTPIYVGQGVNNRDATHLTHSNNSRLRNKINKLRKEGKTLRYTRIIEGLNKEQSDFWEICWIKALGRADLNTGFLYNFTNGGEGCVGRIISDKTRIKLSEKLKGKSLSAETKEKIRKSRTGVKHSPETCEKIKINVKKRFESQELREKLSQNAKAQWASLEAREAQTKRLKGKKLSSESYKAVVQGQKRRRERERAEKELLTKIEI